MSVVAVVVNAGLVAFTQSTTAGLSSYVKVWLFGCIITLILCIKYAVALLIADVPTEVVIQRERQEYINRKIVDDEADEPKISAEIPVPEIDEKTDVYL
jgi:hypothetical protein